jgi:CPA1 family monovalent cation:H+ antiporter
LPRRIVDILEGESLLNDAAGLLALEIGLAIMVRGETPTVESGMVRLIYLVVGGVLIGLLIGVVIGWLERFINDGPVELIVSLIVPYAAYLAGEEAKASGVLAVVTCGLYLSRQSAMFFSPEVRIQVTSAWEALTFVLNGIVFVLIGLQMPYVMAAIHGKYGTGTLVFYGVVFSVILIVLRMIWVFPAVKIASLVRRWFGHEEKELGKRGTFVIGWTGMRGVLALAAAISVPETLANGQPFGPRNLILFLAFCVILVTLVLQGLTLPPLIRALGLAGMVGMDPEERGARRVVVEEALKYLEGEKRRAGEDHAHIFNDLIDRYEHRLAQVDEGQKDTDGRAAEMYEHLVRAGEGALERERAALLRLREDGKISDDVLRTIERELDLEDSRYRVVKV